jgi:hypothetical protein
MKGPSPLDEKTRFSGQMRHYHRSAPPAQRTWDEWVDGKSTGSRIRRNWLKIVLIAIAVIMLGAVIAGLIIELQ